MKKIFTVLAVVLVLFFTFKQLSTSPKVRGVSDEQADLILFWGDGCPHCENVEKHIDENNLDDLVKISYKEVYYNKTNQNLLNETAKKCPEIDTSQGIGVPFALSKSDNKCLYGDQPIIDWLNSRVLK